MALDPHPVIIAQILDPNSDIKHRTWIQIPNEKMKKTGPILQDPYPEITGSWTQIPRENAVHIKYEASFYFFDGSFLPHRPVGPPIDPSHGLPLTPSSLPFILPYPSLSFCSHHFLLLQFVSPPPLPPSSPLSPLLPSPPPLALLLLPLPLLLLPPLPPLLPPLLLSLLHHI